MESQAGRIGVTPPMAFSGANAPAGAVVPWYFNVRFMAESGELLTPQRWLAGGFINPLTGSITSDFRRTRKCEPARGHEAPYWRNAAIQPSPNKRQPKVASCWKQSTAPFILPYTSLRSPVSWLQASPCDRHPHALWPEKQS